MALAQIPPHGELWEAQKRREQRRREQSSLDPVERYMLRENRLQRELNTALTKIIKEKRR